MRIVLSLGGKALVHPGEKPDAEVQLRRLGDMGDTLRSLADWHQLLITFADGAQVGVLDRESRSDPDLRRGFPRDALQAQAQGMLGYWIINELDRDPGAKPSAAVITRVVVDEHDAAFKMPLPTPQPVAIAELPAIADLIIGGNTVVCCGGGGIPVLRDRHGFKRATVASVDHDATAALLARDLKADLLLLITNVAGVYPDYPAPTSEPIRNASSSQLRAVTLAPDSIGRKVTAACDFVDATGARAAIGTLDEVTDLIAGTGGTQIHASGDAAQKHDAAVTAAWDMVGGKA